MSADTASDALRDGEHPSPHRTHASLLTLWLGLLLAPAAWFLALAIDTPLLSQACYPRDIALAGSLPVLMPIVLAVDVATLLVTVFAGFLAWRNWRRTSGEKEGGGGRLFSSGDGRTRFMAMAGMITCGLIFLAVLYAILTHALLPECGL
jgi:hypothetical protein